MKLTAFLPFLALLASGAALAGPSVRPGWGSIPYHDAGGSGVTFRVWAPNATSVFVPGIFNNWSTTANPLGKDLVNGVWNGVWSGDIPAATNGQQYKYFINYSGGSVWKHDPRARLVTYSGSSSGANDIIYDPAAFAWQDDAPVAPAVDDLFIYELHIGTFGGAGANKFLAATNKLDYLKGLGVNAVEVMPVAEFPGDNSWGYNPAQLFAVENVGFGGADGFKNFVLACHRRGLSVLLDVVHNHYGPDDLDMWNFDGVAGSGSLGGGIYFNESNPNLQVTPYGDTRPNFSSLQVSNFVRDNFTLWLSEYHVDGFRWDTPGLMMNADNYGYIAAAGNLINAVNSMIHQDYTNKISIAEDVYNSFGFDSAWDTTFPYTVTPQLTNASDANRDMNVLANAIQYNVRYGGSAGPARVAFLESHDVVGDLNSGVRLVKAIDPTTPNSYRARKLSTLGAALALTAPGLPMIFQGEEMLENQSFDSSLAVDWSKTNTYSRIVQFYRDLIAARRDLKGYTPGLKGDQCSILLADNARKILAFHRWKSAAREQDAVVVANCGNAVVTNYALPLPSSGNWYVHLNSDSTNYSADYSNSSNIVLVASGSPFRASVTISPYTALILSQTPDAPPPLAVTNVNNTLGVTWPAAYAGWSLQQSSALSGSWQPAFTALQTNGPTVSASINPSGAAQFYRLQGP
ncbi:MAG TPA: alpha-amylase family glycosyl hydrolase [Verrucomicrobiae bacterium]|jgi:1,4-alpha-glucan branching enzyme|nr:alpha-amylase family glycosyl hydrolase [Verrucomicrobiae bacterium]